MSKNKKPAPTFPADVKFVHIRYRDGAGNIQSNGGTTIAYREVDGGAIEYALAKCHPRDNYVKTLGRIKAAGRLNSSELRKTFQPLNGEVELVGDDFLDSIQDQIDGWNLNERAYCQLNGVDPDEAYQMFRKYNGKRRKKAAVANPTVDGLGE